MKNKILIFSIFFVIGLVFFSAGKTNAADLVEQAKQKASDAVTDAASKAASTVTDSGVGLMEDIAGQASGALKSGAGTTNANAKTAGNVAADAGSVSFANPLKYDSLTQVLGAVLSSLQGVLGTIAIIILIIGGIMYMLSAGNETMITKAKNTIGGALIGLAIILAAPSFLKEIKNALGGSSTTTNPDLMVSQALSVQQIGFKILNFLLSIVGILGIIALLVGGIMYLVAYGDEDRINLAKKIITNALIGILVASASLILVKQLAALMV